MDTVQTKPASELRAGDSWQWRRDDLINTPPADGWVLSYVFSNKVDKFALTAAEDAGGFLVSQSGAQTADISPGLYAWYAFVSLDDNRHQVGEGQTEVLADVVAAAAMDTRNFPQRLLDAVNAALEARASADQLDLISSAAGDESAARNPEFLLKYRSKLIAEVRRAEAGGTGMRRVVARFP